MGTVNSTTLINWVQIITGIAVVLGLVAVIWELQQSRSAAIAQLKSDGWSTSAQADMAVAGENPKAVLAKACDDPRSLSNEDLWALQGYYFAQTNIIRRTFDIYQRTGLYGDEDWTDAARGRFDQVFFSRPGRIWWRTVRETFPKELADLGDSILVERYESGENTAEGCHIDEWRKSIQAGSDFVPE